MTKKHLNKLPWDRASELKRIEPPPPRHAPIWELRADDCRFATQWDDENRRHLFCGAKTGDVTSPFCRYHQVLAYNDRPPAKVRRFHAETVG